MTVATIDPSKVYICTEAHCSPASPSVVTFESEWRGDHPVVAAAPSLFVEFGTPRGEWRTPFNTVNAVNDANSRELEQAKREAWEKAAAANTVKLEAPRLATAKRDIVCELDGSPATVRKGSKLAENHPIVLAQPDDFS